MNTVTKYIDLFYDNCIKYKPLIIFVSILILIFSFMDLTMFHEYDVTIKDKLVKRINEKDTYLINIDKLNDSKDKIQVVALKDIYWLGSWRTSDDYANIIIGKKYHIKTFGLRIAILSKFPIIYRFNELTEG